ncbi:LysR family transcriptional regulator, partial [Vibrio parahaemolyticus]
MLDLNWLRTFVTLAEVKHFGKTATELHMTQPNVSLHIKQLEQATRTKLIERNPVQLTQAGKRLLATAQRMLNELQICQSDLNAINDLTQGTLSIAASDIVSRLLLIKPFQQFKSEYPGIDLALFNTTSSQAVDLVKSARADIGFVIAQKESQPLHFTPLTQIHWCAFGDNIFEWQNNRKESQTLILLGHDTRTRELIDASLPE